MCLPSGLKAADQASMSGMRKSQARLAVSVPHAQGRVVGDGDNARSVRAERPAASGTPRAYGRSVTPKEDGQALAVGAKDPRDIVEGTGDNERPVRQTMRKRRDPGARNEDGSTLAIGAPHPRCPVEGSGDNARSVRTKRRGIDDTLVPCEEDGDVLAIGVPHPRCPVPEAVTMRAVRAERRGSHSILMAFEDDGDALPVGVPHPRVLSQEAVTMRAPSG